MAVANRTRYRRALREERPRPSFTRRRLALATLMGLAFVSVMASAFYRQILETDFLRHEGERRFLREREIPARRGMILDRNGEPLAISTAVATFTANPRRLVGNRQAINELAAALDLDPEQLNQRVENNRQRGFMYLRRRVEHHRVDVVREITNRYNLEGIGVETEYRRFYPGGESFAQVIGYTDIDDRGQEGIELAYDQHLAPKPGRRRVIQNGRGHIIEEVEQIRPPHHGQDLRLTLDRRLQFFAYRELKRATLEHQAAAACAVLIDVPTGEILALVNQPAFNPNASRTETADQRRNRAITDVFEPGSTVKPFVVAQALEAGLIRPETRIDTSPGTMQVGRNRVRDIRNFGLLDATGVITKSSNIGVVKIAQQMEKEQLWQMYRNLGFGSRTQIGFPSEQGGFLSHFSRWSNFEYATLSFGYGLNATALQLAQAYAVLAREGSYLPATLVQDQPRVGARPVFSPSTADTTVKMMETVVSVQGTARRAAIPGYRVAGKTGTAKKAGPGGYIDGSYQAVFAGIAPLDNPRFVLAVMVDEPGGDHYYGGLVAAPVFAAVMQAALRLYDVPPDAAQESLFLRASTVQ